MDYIDMARSLAAQFTITRSTLMTDTTDVTPDNLNIRRSLTKDLAITLVYQGRVLDPSMHVDGRLAGKCLALRKPDHSITDYYSLWIDWLGQGENAGAMRAVDVKHLRAEWESYLPTPRTQRQKMDELRTEREASFVAEMLPEDHRTLRDQRLERMMEPPAPRERVQIRMKRLHEDAIMPTFGTAGAACFDIYAITDYEGEAYINSTEHPSITCETGWAFEVPEGWVLKVYSRSGQGFKDNTRLANCVGIIDSDYRGPLRVKLTRDDGGTLFVRAGERVAQAMLVRAPVMELIEIGEDEHLSSTDRGERGYGSTGR